ncbi:MAG: HAD-IA family hydrolase [Lachnospiraceae bacterium]|nr:HAD-IA family hydrolase [Lachnospiraceae bacterium]
MQVKYVIFDLDGTLLDTSVGVKQAICYTVKQYGLPVPTEEEMDTFIGPPIYESFVRYYKMSDEESKKATEIFRDAYKNQFLMGATAYDGIYDLLKKLKSLGIKTGVATNKRDDYAKVLLRGFGFDEYFDFILGSDMENKMKKPDIVIKCMEALGAVDKQEVILVGDTVFDMEAAEQIGIGFIGVTYGFGFSAKKQDSDPDILFSRTEEIYKYISNME